MRVSVARWMRVAMTGLVALSPACSLLVEANVEQCAVDADCAARGFTGTQCVARVCVASSVDAATQAPDDPQWGCIGHVAWQRQDPVETAIWRQQFLRVVANQPIRAMSVSMCSRVDPECTAPLGGAVTDDDGIVTLDVPKWFEGFFRMEPPESFPDMVPALGFVPPPERSMAPDAAVPVLPLGLSKLELELLAEQVDATIDPALGQLFVVAHDCKGELAPSVSFRLSVVGPTTRAFYMDTTGVPSITMQESAQRGSGGFANVPPGTVTVEATVNARSKKMGTSTVYVKPGLVTFLLMGPTP